MPFNTVVFYFFSTWPKNIALAPPPELPGPPTNLAVANVGARSVSLQFKPGYDGKTSISRWQVEAQVGLVGRRRPVRYAEVARARAAPNRRLERACPRVSQIGIVGENEEWLTLQQLPNEPDARAMEVLDLNPYTSYR